MIGRPRTENVDKPSMPDLTAGTCREPGRNPEDWFPAKGQGVSRTTTETKRLCREECPVRNQCLEYALHYQLDGVWGGLATRDRRELAKERGITMHEVLASDFLSYSQLLEPRDEELNEVAA